MTSLNPVQKEKVKDLDFQTSKSREQEMFTQNELNNLVKNLGASQEISQLIEHSFIILLTSLS